jgi:E3 ubiquitin-protein ligase ZSWIM2
MGAEMSLSWCSVGCGNNFHLECLKVWAGHRSQEGTAVNCPMCRALFPPSFLADLERQEREFARR